MNPYETLLKLTEDDTVDLTASFKELINKELVLGQSRYLCRHGTLSDGHEKITESSRYYQAIKEMYYLGNNIRSQKAQAMMAQADLLDAQEELENAEKKSTKLRAQGKIIMAQERIATALVTVEDQLRMLDEYNKIRLELKPLVQQLYPEGIEQAEEDNWKAVARYRALKRQAGLPELMTNLPLPKETKTQMAQELGAPDLAAWQEAERLSTKHKLLIQKKLFLINE